MSNEYLCEVEVTSKGYVRIIADSSDEVADNITKGEGYDKNDIEEMQVTDVELVRIISSQPYKPEDKRT